MLRYFSFIFKTKKQAHYFLLYGSTALIIIDLSVVLMFGIDRRTPIKPLSEITHQHPDIHEHEVIITKDGFSPAVIEVRIGESVTWENRDTNPHWPASDVHPTHVEYPIDHTELGSFYGSLACRGVGDPKRGAFDPCAPIAPSNHWTFNFIKKGTWRYHDHLISHFVGIILVK